MAPTLSTHVSVLRASVASLWRTGDLGPLTTRPALLWWSAVVGAMVVVALMVIGAPVGPVVMFVLVSAGVVIALKAIVPPADRRPIFRVAAVVYLAHVLAATALFAVSYLRGNGGFYFGDDETYATAARLVAEYIRGIGNPHYAPPDWGGYAYLLILYSWIEAAIFTVLGQEVVSALILNAGISTLTVLFVYIIVKSLFGRPAALLAAVLAGFFPSVFLWDVLNLKDALALFLAMGVFALIARLQWSPRVIPFVGVLVLFIMIADVRLWIFYLLAPCFVVALAIAPHRRPLQRLGWAVAAVAATMTIAEFATSGTTAHLLGPSAMFTLADIRQAMAAPARSGYGGATPLPVPVTEGAVLVVTTPEPSASPLGVVRSPGTSVSGSSPVSSPPPATSPQQPSGAGTPAPSSVVSRTPGSTPGLNGPTPTPTTIVVRPGTGLVLAPTPAPGVSTGPIPTPPPDTVYVHPGDRVIVLSSGTPPTETSAPQPILVSAQKRRVTVSTEEVIGVAVVSHIPEGMLYALFAPLPWQSPWPATLGVTPDMMLWYLISIAGLVTLWRESSRWRVLLPLVLYVAGGIGVFALVEGNLGTLFRHRAMIILPVVVLASPVLLQWAAALRDWLPKRLGLLADWLVAQMR